MSTKSYHLHNFIVKVEKCVFKHQIRPGAFLRWTLNDDDHGEANPYGCSDAANILYTIGSFQKIQIDRSAWIKELLSLQNSETGLFNEKTHHTIHTTAHCLAALELFDTQSPVPLKGLSIYKSPEHLRAFMETCDWQTNPWSGSHRGAGLYAALVLAGEADADFCKTYFDWLWEESCPETGFWRKKCVEIVAPSEKQCGAFPHLASSFHYLFNHEYAKMPLRFPQKMIDSCLSIYDDNLWPSLGTTIGFAEIDWVYCLTRASRQCHHRHSDVQQALESFRERYLEYLLDLDFENHERLDDLHMLFGSLCCIAELQEALLGTIFTPKPLRLVLNRRPFI